MELYFFFRMIFGACGRTRIQIDISVNERAHGRRSTQGSGILLCDLSHGLFSFLLSNLCRNMFGFFFFFFFLLLLRWQRTAAARCLFHFICDERTGALKILKEHVLPQSPFVRSLLMGYYYII